jgi:serpin B
MVRGMAMPAEVDATFVADHPYLFLLRDRRSGAILFLGRVVEPS